MTNDPFGFSTARKVAARLAEIRPEEAPRTDAPVAALDRAAATLGFLSREPAAENPAVPSPPAGPVAEAIVRRRREVGPGAQLNVKCPVPVYNRFVRFCDVERLTYWEGIARLLDLAGVDPQGVSAPGRDRARGTLPAP